MTNHGDAAAPRPLHGQGATTQSGRPGGQARDPAAVSDARTSGPTERRVAGLHAATHDDTPEAHDGK